MGNVYMEANEVRFKNATYKDVQSALTAALNGGGGGGGAAEDITYDNTSSGLTATNVQAAIDEVVGDLGDLAASGVSFDNTGTEFQATDVQTAIVEAATMGGGGGAAEDITYDNTGSGLTADDVQEAIDELAGDLGDLAASGVSFDNTGTEFLATDVQAAIVEAATMGGGGSMDLYPSTATKVGSISGVGDIYRKFAETNNSLPDGAYTSSVDLGTGIINSHIRVVNITAWGRKSDGTIRLFPDKDVIISTTISGFAELMIRVAVSQNVNLSDYKLCFIADYIITT